MSVCFIVHGLSLQLLLLIPLVMLVLNQKERESTFLINFFCRNYIGVLLIT